MSPARDFGAGGGDPAEHSDGNHDPPGDDADQQPENHPNEKEDPTMLPEPLNTPDDDPPEPARAIEGPKPATESRDVEIPSAERMHAMFPDAFPKNTPERRARHLAPTPDLDDPTALPALEDIDQDDNDPLIAAALRWRALMTFWWRPAATLAVVVIVGVVAFFASGIAVGIAWCVYGIGHTAYSVWHVHGRPSLHQLVRARRGGW